MTDILTTLQSAFPGGWVLALPALGLGYLAGLLHFRSLALVADRLVAGDLTAVALQCGRLAALGGFLWLLVLLGAVPLVAATAGLLLARSRVLAGARGVS